MSHTGSCLCGNIRFALQELPPNAYQCFCSLCRRTSGAYSNSATLVHQHAFTWTSGQGHIRSWSSTAGYRMDFCNACGGTVPKQLRQEPLMWVPLGTLDALDVPVRISHQIYVADAVAPVATAPSIQQFDTTPGLTALIEGIMGPANTR
ncbi:MAG: GFA family protein [Pseudomonadota bacterium]